MEKATRKQVKRHNRRLVLRAVYEERADNRAALALETGLTKPTVSNIINDLMYRGFVAEVGRGESTSSGGKRPTLLSFIPTARQVIGVSMSRTEVIGCLSNLDGLDIARHVVTVTESLPLMDALHHTIAALMAQRDAQILCISVGVPGIVDDDAGIVKSSPVLDWYNLNLADSLRLKYDVPVYIGNNTEFATRTQIVYSREPAVDSLVTVFVGDSIEVGTAFGADFYQHSGLVSSLRLAQHPHQVSFLEWQQIKARVQALVEEYPNSLLAQDDTPLFLDIRRACLQGDEAALIIQEEIASALAQVFSWIIALLRPDKIVLAGVMSLMGDKLLHKTQEKISAMLPDSDTSRLSLADLSHNLELRGAVAHGLNQELGIV